MGQGMPKRRHKAFRLRCQHTELALPLGALLRQPRVQLGLEAPLRLHARHGGRHRAPLAKGVREGRIAHPRPRAAHLPPLVHHLLPCAEAARELGVAHTARRVQQPAAVVGHLLPRAKGARKAALEHAAHRLLLPLLDPERARRLRLFGLSLALAHALLE
jgi:hypothetical protein